MASVQQVAEPAPQPGNGKPSDLASAITAALVSAGVGAKARHARGRARAPVWGAGLDTAITQAITLLPWENGRDATERRRKVAVAMGE